MSDNDEVMSTRERLIYMANQIARNFGAIHHGHAVEAVADHIASFWDPRMRAQIAQVLQEDSGALADVTRAAVELLQQGLPAHQSPATVFNAVDEIGHADGG